MANKAEMAVRVSTAAAYLLSETPGHSQFTDWAMAKFDISRALANGLWKKAWTDIEKNNVLEVEWRRAQYRSQLQKLYKEALEDTSSKGVTAAKGIMEALIKLDGLYVVKTENKHEVEIKGNPFKQMQDNKGIKKK